MVQIIAISVKNLPLHACTSALVQSSLGCDTQWKIMSGMLYGRKFCRSCLMFKFQRSWHPTHCFYKKKRETKIQFDLTRKCCSNKLSAINFNELRGYGPNLVTRLPPVTFGLKAELLYTVINIFWVGPFPWQCSKISCGSSKQQLKGMRICF